MICHPNDVLCSNTLFLFSKQSIIPLNPVAPKGYKSRKLGSLAARSEVPLGDGRHRRVSK